MDCPIVQYSYIDFKSKIDGFIIFWLTHMRVLYLILSWTTRLYYGDPTFDPIDWWSHVTLMHVSSLLIQEWKWKKVFFQNTQNNSKADQKCFSQTWKRIKSFFSNKVVRLIIFWREIELDQKWIGMHRRHVTTWVYQLSLDQKLDPVYLIKEFGSFKDFWFNPRSSVTVLGLIVRVRINSK